MPPEPVTGVASPVNADSATLRGTVNPRGAEAAWQFEYGTNTAYGSRTASASAGSGSAAVDVSAAISGLAPGRVYHFRLAASNTWGTLRPE